MTWTNFFFKVVLALWVSQAASQLPKAPEAAGPPVARASSLRTQRVDKEAYKSAYLVNVPDTFFEWHKEASKGTRRGPSEAEWTYGAMPVSNLHERRQRWEAAGVQADFDAFHTRNNPVKVKRYGSRPLLVEHPYHK
jgi:hypothetical protein